MRIFVFSLIGFFLLAGCTPKTASIVTQEKPTNFSASQSALIMDKNGEYPMRLFLTTNPTDYQLLRTKSEVVDVTSADPTLDNLIKRMYATVRDSLSLGVGIAAPQVGVLKNIIWVQRFDKDGFPFEVYLNPVIRQYSEKKQDCMEGCLSIPDKQAKTKTRAYAILLEYDTREGEHKVEMVEDFTAVIFQHEIDHLNGILFTDLLEE